MHMHTHTHTHTHQVKDIARKNINKVVGRGERLDGLKDKTGKHEPAVLKLF